MLAVSNDIRRDLRCAAQRHRAAHPRPAARGMMDIPIIDVWTQHIRATPPGVNPEGENVFRNYGMLDVFHQGTDVARMVEAMDRHGVRAALMAGDNKAVARAQRAHPGRIFGEYHASPTDIMRAVRELEHYVRDCGLVP